MLLANGHLDATSYPIGMVSDEIALTVKRTNGMVVTEGVVLQAAAASIMSKEGGKHFTELLKRLSGD